MPRIFDNIEQHLLPILQDTLKTADRADFCVGYFNLRGWQKIDQQIEHFTGGNHNCCRLLIGMQKLPQDILYESLSFLHTEKRVDQGDIIRGKKAIAQEFYKQLTLGAPTNEYQASLRRLKHQIQSQKLTVKLFLKYPLHAKLYLIHRQDLNNPITGFLGSSNLTLSGLQIQGELNIDVLDHDSCNKLQKWFDDRWNDRYCIDISQEIVNIIDQSWASETLIPPYHIYLKIAYHLSSEARAGLLEYQIPQSIKDQLFDFQSAAVKIAARHVHQRGGVLLGDVVGLGKTRIAATLAKILEEDFFLETLIICPKNLVSMWQDYVHDYKLRADVLSISKVQKELPKYRRFRVVLIDESHNLRNREGKRYQVIKDYINLNESRCILLTATPYNKTYLDLSSQLRLFIPEEKNLGIRPENLIRELGGEKEFNHKYQIPTRCLGAFEKSEYSDDWRDLMRLYMIRRPRSFIQKNYAQKDENGKQYLLFADGSKSYFPIRVPKTLTFNVHDYDIYGILYSENVVNLLNNLNLPRYGLGNYIITEKQTKTNKITDAELTQLKNLSRAGKRLMGFCRTNLFKRLESSGFAFLQSIERHILRNYVFLHAIAHKLPLPIGTQDIAFLDTRNYDDDDIEEINIDEDENIIYESELDLDYQKQAAKIYQTYQTTYQKRFKWVRSELFKPSLKQDLQNDVLALINLLQTCGKWQPDQDQKLQLLIDLITEKHPQEKILVFTQFADTVHYVTQELKGRNITKIEGVTGNSDNLTETAHKFSPLSNNKKIPVTEQLRILITTDVLSEGLNLQDCAIIINYDLPWAIIRLIQRAGRIDRIGQNAPEIICYSFLPAEGVEDIIKLRMRLRQRLKENAEVVGTDETFFEEDMNQQTLLDLYHEKSEIFDDQEDTEIDLTSEAYQIWKNAIETDPSLEKKITSLSNMVYSTREHHPTLTHPEGVLMYMKTAAGNDILGWFDQEGKSITQSQFTILRSANCHPQTPAINHHPEHHQIVLKGTEFITEEEKRNDGAQLGSKSSSRFQTYHRLKNYFNENKGTLFATEDLKKAIDQIYKYPLRQSTMDKLNRCLKSGVNDQQLAEVVTTLFLDDSLCIIHKDDQNQEPQIICSLGMFDN